MANRYRNRHAVRIEEPAAALDPLLVAMQQQMMQAQRQAAVSIADQRRLRQWVEHWMAHATSWERRAVLAVRAGDDELARQALHRKTQCDEEAASYKSQWEDQTRGVESLRTGLTALSQQISQAHRQRNALIARTVAAQARLSIANTLAQLDSASPWGTLQHMEDRVVQLESEAEAAADLNSYGDSSLEARFAALEAGSVDDDLASLKASMGLGPRALSS
ncbi:MAG: PspA/IM30 family protein [Nannocystaceae bacterium]|nr:PspA/IM30 family protein [Nannocystaceae bacterium]